MDLNVKIDHDSTNRMTRKKERERWSFGAARHEPIRARRHGNAAGYF